MKQLFHTFKKSLMPLVALLLAGPVLIEFFFRWVLPYLTAHGVHIVVPNLVGLSYQDAQHVVAKSRLKVIVMDESLYSMEHAPGVVLQQHPRAGAEVKRGRRVYLAINALAPPQVEMPDLLHGSLRSAKLRLKAFGLEMGVLSHIPDLAEGAVLKQQYQGAPIEPGTLIARGSRIDLTVGTGLTEERVRAPQLIGLPWEEAETILLEAGVQMGDVHFVGACHQAQGTMVCQQIPEHGQRIRLGESIDLWVRPKTLEEQEATQPPVAGMLPEEDPLTGPPPA